MTIQVLTLLQKLLYHSQLSMRKDEIFFRTGSKSDFFRRSESERQEGTVNGSSRSRKVLVEDLG